MNTVIVTRQSAGEYTACVKVGSLNPHGVVGFKIEGHNYGKYWTMTNYKGNEVLDGTHKADLVQYLKTSSPERIVELWSE
jgi:hypothetical protein